MKLIHLFRCSVLFVAVLAMTANPILAMAQSLYDLPVINLHNSAADGQGAFNPIPMTIDMNKDGLADLVYSRRDQQAHWEQWMYLNTGTGFTLVFNCSYNSITQLWSGDCTHRN